MTMFDNSDFKVRMTGKEYLDYKKYKDSLPPYFSKQQVRGLIIITVTIIVAILALAAIKDIFQVETVAVTSKQIFLNSITSLSDLTWDNLLKLFFITHIEVIGIVVLLIGVAWVLHGFGFIIIKR